MHLVHFTLQPASAVSGAVVGAFRGQPRQQEIVVARGTRLELLAVDDGLLKSIVVQDADGLVRSIAQFRLVGSSKDYIVCTSDSGKISILEFDMAKQAFVPVHNETFGKTGMRRVVPGEYLATDPKGRALMVAAVEHQKFVYVLNRDALARLTISSPLESHRSRTIVYSCVGVDVGFDNPVFACLEVSYAEADEDPSGQSAAAAEKMLVYYELDLGLNHIVRKWSVAVHRRANILIPIPGGDDGPGGVLVCSEGRIEYHRPSSTNVHVVPIPRKSSLAHVSRPAIIIRYVVHRMKHAFFILLQSEDGDLFRVSLHFQSDQVDELKISFFDAVPISSAICILKSGYLFVAAESGDHTLYRVERLGDDEHSIEFSSHHFIDQDFSKPIFFDGHTELHNLLLTDAITNLSPVTRAGLLDSLSTSMPSLAVLSGKRDQSSLSILSTGIPVTELAVSNLPGQPLAIWTVHDEQNALDKYIVIAFQNATLVLSVGESVEEVTDSGIAVKTTTLAIQTLAGDASSDGATALAQIYPAGIRHIKPDKRVSEWRAPPQRPIVHCSTNTRQIIVALSGGELVYFELDAFGQLNEYQDRMAITANITSMSVASVSPKSMRSNQIAIACDDKTIRIVSLEPDTCLQLLSVLGLDAIPESVFISSFDSSTGNYFEKTHNMYVHVGLVNGVLLRSTLDPASGQLTDTRPRFLGTNPVRLTSVKINNKPALLALSSKTWLISFQNEHYKVSPVLYDPLDCASAFSSSHCPEGVVGVSKRSLRYV